MTSSLSGHQCHCGGYYGDTEAFFRDQGTSCLVENGALICSNELNALFRHQCVHGIGQELVAWTSYEMNETLEICKELSEVVGRRSWYSGIFMENVAGGLSGSMGHFPEQVSNDPHLPCDTIDTEYVNTC